MVKITGAAAHSARLRHMTSPAAKRQITQALYAGGQIIEIEAERSITEGSVSGKNHVASLPGEPPNADTRLLDTSIETTVEDPEALKATVTSNAPYGADLELGNSKMEARPYMRPATQKKRGEATDLVHKVVARIVREGDKANGAG